MRIKSSMMDKELRTAGRLMRILNGAYTVTGFRLLNRMMKILKMRIKDDTLQFSEEWIPRGDGSMLRVCIFRPPELTGKVPGVLWLHGGGYAIGSPEQALPTAKKLMEASPCVVIAPDYRLSVEAPYPAALEDSYEALLWMKSHAQELGIRENQLMAGGDSAGGGLTAALTLYARDKGEAAIAFQMPLYPMLDDRMAGESARDNNAPVWNSRANRNGWKLYLGGLSGSADVPYYAAPARAEYYGGLPPTATFVGELEPFRDETIQYAENLMKARVPVDFEIYKGCYHAFEQMCPRAEVSKKATAFLMDSFRYAAEHYFAEQPVSLSRDAQR